jgi:Zn-dependent peptidase ImmA (M78 family)
MSTLIEIARQAQRAALETRRRAGMDRDAPVCVFDLAESIGLEVKFRPETSLEGMYCKGSPGVILVSAHRPPGRQAFSCAHELGHHTFGHGTRVDEYLADGCRPGRDDPEERLADFYAAHLLMPIAAVRRAFVSRGWDVGSCTPEQAYIVACYLGVGYNALINHLRWTVRLISPQQSERLQSRSPKQLRQSLLGESIAGQVVVVDTNWVGRAVDLEVGDRAILPAGVRTEGGSIRVVAEGLGRTIAEATRAGISRIESGTGQWAVYVRVARRKYVGRNCFRFNEDPDENERTGLH